MSRPYNIQDRTKRQLASINKRVSNKKSRYRREKGIELNPLVQTKKPSDFTSSKEVEQYKRQMERFLDRKTQFVANSNNVLFSTKTVQRYEREVERINRIKKREFERIKDLETQFKGKKLGATVGKRMEYAPNILFKSVQPIKASLDAFASEKDLKEMLKTKFTSGSIVIDGEKKPTFYSGNFIQRKARQYKQNFIDSLQNEFAGKSANLQRKIKRMSLNEFMNVYYQTLGQIDIEFVYDDNANEDTRLDTLEQTFNF